jgi:hypothetical protein
MFFMYVDPVDPVRGSKDFLGWLAYLPRRVETESESPYTNAQLRNAFNTVVSLIPIASDAKVSFSLIDLGVIPWSTLSRVDGLSVGV